jgi:hypothetical protein
VTLPAALTILGRRYTVEIHDTLGSLGACQNDRQAIFIDPASHPQTQASVLLHEVIEAINASMGLHLKHRKIDALETALFDVLISNAPWWEETA